MIKAETAVITRMWRALVHLARLALLALLARLARLAPIAPIAHIAFFPLVAMLAAPAFAAQPSDAEPAPGEYRIVNGQVDNGTYTGWRLFHTTCYGCHGVDAGGTNLAPNLVDRIKALTPREFATKVLTSYRLMQPEDKVNDSPADREEALEALIERMLRKDRLARDSLQMPAWQDNPRVRPHVMDLYAYLTARADGKLPPGEPRRIKEPSTR